MRSAERVFFYGSFMNPEVLREAGWSNPDAQACVLEGWDIQFQPTANIFPRPDHQVWGAVVTAPCDLLRALYDPASSQLDQIYAPIEIEVERANGEVEPVLTYVADLRAAEPADLSYVMKIIEPGRQYRFPRLDLERLLHLARGEGIA